MFADTDTRSIARDVHQISYAHGHFDPAGFERVLRDTDTSDCLGMAYGSGFEATPELLEIAARYLPVIGNTPQTLRLLKKPETFFELLDDLKIPYPEISYHLPLDPQDWLCKQVGGSGGTHIQYAEAGIDLAPGSYFQRYQAGETVSLLFAADGEKAWAVGFNRQWTVPSADMPFRYGGAVSQAELSESVQKSLIVAAEQLSQAAGLRGLNSLDAVVLGGQVWLLEINPRLSATFDLYHVAGESQETLMDLHLCSSLGGLENFPELSLRSRAHQVVYSPFEFVVTDAIIWPDWVADVPVPGSIVLSNAPLCTVMAEGDDDQMARWLVSVRTEMLTNMLMNMKG